MAATNVDFAGKLAVITGGGDGIGKAIAAKLAQYGSHLALVDIRDTVHSVASNMRALFPSISVHSFVCDMTNEDAVKALVDDIKSSFNTQRIQMLFNNVGIGGMSSTLYGDIDRLKMEMDCNLWTMVYGTRLFLPMLLANDPKEQCFIVNTGSIASIETGFNWYGVTKHAVIAYSETLREELKRAHPQHSILVSTLVPAFVETKIRKNSALQLKYAKNEEESHKLANAFNSTKMGKMIQQTQISVSELANIAVQGLMERKAVIPTHLDWHEAVIKDRMEALLECRKDKKSRMRTAVRARMSKHQTSKL